MKKFIVKMMISTYKGAKHYYEEAISCEDQDAKRVFKDLAAGETVEFEKLCHLYKAKMDHGVIEHDYWLEHFREEVDEIRKKIAEIA